MKGEKFMNFSIEQSILIEHLNYVIKGISTKNLIPILNCIKFELEQEGLYLISTDNEMAIKTFIPKEKIQKIESLGEVVVFGRFIFDIIRKLPNEIVNIEEVASSKLFITTTNSSFNLNCNNVDDFPMIDLEDAENLQIQKYRDNQPLSEQISCHFLQIDKSKYQAQLDNNLFQQLFYNHK